MLSASSRVQEREREWSGFALIDSWSLSILIFNVRRDQSTPTAAAHMWMPFQMNSNETHFVLCASFWDGFVVGFYCRPISSSSIAVFSDVILNGFFVARPQSLAKSTQKPNGCFHMSDIVVVVVVVDAIAVTCHRWPRREKQGEKFPSAQPKSFVIDLPFLFPFFFFECEKRTKQITH